MNAMRRGVSSRLIDALYEHRVHLSSPPQDVRRTGSIPRATARFDFRRAASRLIEMQSPDYLALCRICE